MTCARRLAGARTPAPSTSAGPRRPDARTGRARARRLTLLLPVLALLAGAFPLFAPASAQAQNTPVWSATLATDQSTQTGAILNSQDEFYGCANGIQHTAACSTATKLTEDEFTHGTPSATYTVTALGLNVDDDGDDKWYVTFSGLTGAAAKTALTGLTMNVGTTAYAIADGTASGNRLTWTSSLGWTSSTRPSTVAVSLTSGSSAPSAPTNLGVSPGNGSLSLTWTAPSGTLTGYDVHYTSAASGTVSNSATASGNNAATAWVAVSRTETSPPTASQTISSLSNGTAYRVRVRAKNAAGNGAWVFGSGTPAVPALPAPSNIAWTAGDRQITATWDAWTGYTPNDVKLRWRVKDTDPNQAGDQAGA